jgi:hypothetical protein
LQAVLSGRPPKDPVLALVVGTAGHLHDHRAQEALDTGYIYAYVKNP